MLRLNFRRHPSQETLSEYLDGRLDARAAGKLEAHLSSCSACGRQLEELRTTVGLLRQVPVLTPRRSFILTEAPAPSGAVERRRARTPAWAAALATSAAAVAFFAVLSTDLSGGLSSTPPPRDEATPTVAAAATAVEETQSSAEAQLAPRPGEEGSAAEAPSLEMAAPAGTPPVAAAESSEAPSLEMAAPADTSAAAAAESSEPPSLEMAAPAAAPLAEDAGFETEAQQAGGEVERVVAEPEAAEELPASAEEEDPPPVAAPEAAKELPVSDEEETPVTAAAPEAAEAVEDDVAAALLAEAETPGYWRVIEALLGASALLLGAGLLVIWRRSRTTSP